MRSLVILLAGASTLAACGGETERSVTPPEPVALVTISGPDSLLFGQTATLLATPQDAAGNPLTGRAIAWQSLNPAVATVTASGEVTVIDTGSFTISAVSEGIGREHSVTGWSLEFIGVSAGNVESCALTAAGRVYCWGRMAQSEAPVALAGSRAFATVDVGDGQACRLTPAGEGFCWTDPALGAAAIAGAPALSQISLGSGHTCGIDLTGLAWCWGSNESGRLGTGLIPDSPSPAAVAGGEHYGSISSGIHHTCAVTTAGAGACWGSNGNAQLGAQVAGSAYAPAPVEGGLTFLRIEAGLLHSCGIAADSTAYCWGDNPFGVLGTNNTMFSTVPITVAGGFKAIQGSRSPEDTASPGSASDRAVMCVASPARGRSTAGGATATGSWGYPAGGYGLPRSG